MSFTEQDLRDEFARIRASIDGLSSRVLILERASCDCRARDTIRTALTDIERIKKGLVEAAIAIEPAAMSLVAELSKRVSEVESEIGGEPAPKRVAVPITEF